MCLSTWLRVDYLQVVVLLGNRHCDLLDPEFDDVDNNHIQVRVFFDSQLLDDIRHELHEVVVGL